MTFSAGARRKLLLAGAVALVILGSSACAPAAVPPACISPANLGFSIGRLSGPALDKQLSELQDVGATWVRFDVDWSVIEPIRGQRDWSTVDLMVAAITSRGLKPLAILAYTPQWARAVDGPADNSHTRPQDASQFGDFAKEAAQRYGGLVTHWEIWNEPNSANFFAPRADVAHYAELLAASAAAIRSVQPVSTILSGGLAPAVDDDDDRSPITFLTELYEAKGGKNFDAVGVHPYSYPAMPDDQDTADWNTFLQLPGIHREMVKNGDGAKKVWLTEWGAPTGTDARAVSAVRQSQIIARGLARASEFTWIGPIVIYSLVDAGTNVADLESNFGVVRHDYVPKPAYAVVRDATATSCGQHR